MNPLGLYSRNNRIRRAIHYSLISPYLNYESAKLYRSKTPQLNDNQSKIVEALQRKGISQADISEFLPDFDEIRDGAHRELESSTFRNRVRMVQEARPAEGRPKFYNLQVWENPIIDFKKKVIQFFLSDSIVAIAAAYLGVFPRLLMMNLWYNIPMEGEDILSQNWHRDGDDLRCLKVFLYLNDVDGDMGPFSYVPESQNGNKLQTEFPFRSKLHNGETSKAIEHKFRGSIIRCTGKAGSLVFCDTTGLHKGGHSSSKPRFVVVASFITNGSIWRDRHDFTTKDLDTNGAKSQLVKHSLWLK